MTTSRRVYHVRPEGISRDSHKLKTSNELREFYVTTICDFFSRDINVNFQNLQQQFVLSQNGTNLEALRICSNLFSKNTFSIHKKNPSLSDLLMLKKIDMERK